MQFIILVAEDDLTLRLLAKRQLNKLGFECHLAADGKEAVEKAAALKYDAIMMDIHMPNMNGIEATHAIRKNDKHKNDIYTPIIAMSANPNSQNCFSAGMDDFLFKPITLDNLRDTLQRWIR